MELQHEETISVQASPERVWDLVTDIGRTGEWSPVCTHCEWDDDAGPVVGARFTGHNEADGRRWQTRSTVVVAEPGRKFGWEVGDGFVRWGYAMVPVDDGTALTETWEMTPAGVTMFGEKYGERADEMIATRAAQAHDGIPATLSAIKRIAEDA